MLYRGVSPDVLMLDQTGYLQVGVVIKNFKLAALCSTLSLFNSLIYMSNKGERSYMKGKLEVVNS